MDLSELKSSKFLSIVLHGTPFGQNQKSCFRTINNRSGMHAIHHTYLLDLYQHPAVSQSQSPVHTQKYIAVEFACAYLEYVVLYILQYIKCILLVLSLYLVYSTKNNTDSKYSLLSPYLVYSAENNTDSKYSLFSPYLMYSTEITLL